MAENEDMGLRLQEGQVLRGKVFKEALALLIIGHLRVKHGRHKYDIGEGVVMHTQWRGKNLLDPPQVDDCMPN